MKILSAHNYRNKHFFKKRETLKKKKKKAAKMRKQRLSKVHSGTTIIKC